MRNRKAALLVGAGIWLGSVACFTYIDSIEPQFDELIDGATFVGTIEIEGWEQVDLDGRHCGFRHAARVMESLRGSEDRIAIYEPGRSRELIRGEVYFAVMFATGNSGTHEDQRVRRALDCMREGGGVYFQKRPLTLIPFDVGTGTLTSTNYDTMMSSSGIDRYRHYTSDGVFNETFEWSLVKEYLATHYDLRAR